MAGADHVSINSKVTMKKLQKINYKGESRYEYPRKVLFTRQNISWVIRNKLNPVERELFS